MQVIRIKFSFPQKYEVVHFVPCLHSNTLKLFKAHCEMELA